jgi:hypothetical protein
VQLRERIRKNRRVRVAIASGRRFITKDPIRFDGGYNLYAYANDDPVNFFDPTGEAAWVIPVGIGIGFGAKWLWTALTIGTICGTAASVATSDTPIPWVPPANDNGKTRDQICAEKAAALKVALEAMGKPPDEIAKITGAFWSACMQAKDTYPYKDPK